MYVCMYVCMYGAPLSNLLPEVNPEKGRSLGGVPYIHVYIVYIHIHTQNI